MSKIGELGKEFANLPKLLIQYDDTLREAMDILPIKDKTLEKAQREQCAYYVYYDERRAELKTLVKYLTAHVSKVRGSLVRQYNEHGNRALGERMINSYVDNEPDYLKAYELLLEVEELYDKYVGVVEAFNKRGFSLRDITLARVHEVSNTPL